MDRAAENPVSPSAGRVWAAANATVFLSSFCVMVIELVAGRIISRHLGASLYTWTSVIGVVLGGLAAGNWVGGRIADRYRARPTLSVLFGSASAACVTILVLDNLVGGLTPLWELSWPARVASHVTLVFFLPAALLGTIGPVVGKMALDLGRGTGRTLGSVYAWGVIGSIVGTFSTGYFLVSLLGTDAIIWTVAAVLAICGVVYSPLSARAWGWTAAVAACCLLGNGSWAWAQDLGRTLALRTEQDPTVLYRDESRYSRIEVRTISQVPEIRGMFLDKLLHSQISMDDPLRMHYGYVSVFSALTGHHAPEKSQLRTLTIGGGGLVFPRYLEATWPGSTVEVVEIDPAVTRAARLAFGFPETSKIRIHHMDGRVFVTRKVEARRRGVAAPQYDFIYLDAVNDFSVPFQLTTAEFFEDVGELLAPNGLFLINFIEVLDSGRLAGALLRTVEEVFPHVGLFSEEHLRRVDGDSRVTLVLAASRKPLDWPLNATVDGVSRVSGEILERYRRTDGELVLRDTYAPVENLVAPVVRASARARGASDALQRALRREANGDQEGFVTYCREALRLDPRFPEAHFNLGVALSRRGEWEQALSHWNRALQLNPDYAEAHFNLGAVMFQRGKLERAHAHLLAATRIKPEMAIAHNALGIVAEARGELRSAARHFEQALRVDPLLDEARGHLSRVRRRAAEL